MQVPDYETTRPSIIIDHHRKPFNQIHHPEELPDPIVRRNSSNLSNRSRNGSVDYPKVELKLINNAGNRPSSTSSITTLPLPPIPPPEPLYEELQMIDKGNLLVVFVNQSYI